MEGNKTALQHHHDDGNRRRDRIYFLLTVCTNKQPTKKERTFSVMAGSEVASIKVKNAVKKSCVRVCGMGQSHEARLQLTQLNQRSNIDVCSPRHAPNLHYSCESIVGGRSISRSFVAIRSPCNGEENSASIGCRDVFKEHHHEELDIDDRHRNGRCLCKPHLQLRTVSIT